MDQQQNIHLKLNSKHLRGSAITELLILTFPYAMILIGMTVLGMLALGKQEARKATLLASPWPGKQSLADIDGLVFQGMDSNPKIELDFEEDNDYVPEQFYSDQEPVLPYRDSSESGEFNDIHAGFVHLGYTATSSSDISAGEVTTEQSVEQNSTGRYLEEYGIMPDREDDVAEALNGWVEYSRARAEFSYEYGGNAGHFEERAADQVGDTARYNDTNPRERFNLKDYDGEEGLKNFSAARTDLDRGTHTSGGVFEEGDVDFSAISDLPSIVTTFNMTEPGQMYYEGNDSSDYAPWNSLNYSSEWDN